MEKLSTTVGNIREKIRRWVGKTFIIILLSLLFFVTAGGVSHNTKWRIDRVDISGAKSVPEDVARLLVRQKLEGNYFFVYSRENSRLFPSKEIEKMLLETFPRIKNVFVSRADNQTILVEVTERKPYALWCGADEDNRGTNEEAMWKKIGEDCWFIDEEGFVFDRAPVFSRGVYIEVYGELIEKKFGEPLRASLPYSRFANANVFAKLIHDNVGKPYQITIKPEGEFEISIKKSAKYLFIEETVLRIKDESNPAVLLNNLLTAIPVQFPDSVPLKKKLLYIDMRFGNKVIFGFEN